MNKVDFSIFSSLEIISKNYGIDLGFLEYMFERKYLDDTFYQYSMAERSGQQVIIGLPKVYSLRLPKKNKKLKKNYRNVIVVVPPYSRFYKNLLYDIESVIRDDSGKINECYILNNVHGFIIKKNTLTNAQQHLNKKYLLKIDIKDFFESINEDNIEDVFLKLGCNQDGAKLFARLCTIDQKLKEGINTSPILANLHCFSMDNDLLRLSQKYELTFTRYSDDITLSSNKNSFPSISNIEQLFNKHGFKLNSQKINFSKEGQPQYVTGLSISNSIAPKVPPKMKRKIRQELYYIRKYGVDSHFDHIKMDVNYGIRRLFGRIVYILGIEKKIGAKLKNDFFAILSKQGVRPDQILNQSNLYNTSRLKAQIFHYVDETEIVINDDHYLALSIVSIMENHRDDSFKKLHELRKSILTDRYNGIKEEKLDKLFHYGDDIPKVRLKYIELLRSLQFESFIAFAKCGLKKNEYQKGYNMIFLNMFYNILRRYHCHINRIYYEENSKVSQKTLIRFISDCIPRGFKSISPIAKNNILLSMPDYILGIFRRCMTKTLYPFEENQFEEISSKIVFVLDMENRRYYSRQKLEKFNCRKFHEVRWNTWE